MCKNLRLGKDDATGIRYLSFGHGAKTMVIVPGLNIGYVTDAAQAVAEGFAAFVEDYTVYLFDIRWVGKPNAKVGIENRDDPLNHN